jgi:hypothetical protein
MHHRDRPELVQAVLMHVVLAYIDPGSGSLAIQAVIAALVAAPFVLRHQIGRLMNRLRGGQPAAPDAAADVNNKE